jgi:putative zinc finger/helix-turn-helix YgiT family protein
MKTNQKRKIGEWKLPGECIACGSESGFAHKLVHSEKVVHGETFSVGHHCHECRDCGFRFLGPDEMDEAVRFAVSAYQTQHELLTAQELRGLRKKMKWSQTDLARYSGLGIATIKRLELGCTVQTKTNNAALVQCFSQDQPIGEILEWETAYHNDIPSMVDAAKRPSLMLNLCWISLPKVICAKPSENCIEDLLVPIY